MRSEILSPVLTTIEDGRETHYPLPTTHYPLPTTHSPFMLDLILYVYYGAGVLAYILTGSLILY